MRLLTCILIVFVCGCAKVGVTTVNMAASKPSGCQIEVYTDAIEINKKYEVTCLIDSRTGTTAFHDKSGAAAIEQAKNAACKCGADAIIIQNVQTQGVTMTTWGQGSAIIKAIRYIN